MALSANIEDGVLATPRRKYAMKFYYIVGAVLLLLSACGREKPRQIQKSESPALESLRNLAPIPGRPMDPEYKAAFGQAVFFKDPEAAEAARIALAQLPMVPTYHFPEMPLPAGWPTAEHWDRGYPGLLASIVVELGDKATVDQYRKALSSASPELKRVMVWGLGRSTEQVDFDHLMEIEKSATDAGMRDTATRALNRMIVSMRSAAEYSEMVREARRPKDPAALAKAAAQNEARLKAQNLVVELSPYD
jgi:hypothetical protein